MVVTKLSASAVASDTPNKPRDKNELVCAVCAVSVGGISNLVPISNEFLARTCDGTTVLDVKSSHGNPSAFGDI